MKYIKWFGKFWKYCMWIICKKELYCSWNKWCISNR